MGSIQASGLLNQQAGYYGTKPVGQINDVPNIAALVQSVK